MSNYLETATVAADHQCTENLDSFGAQPLFEDVSFTVSEGSRIGLIGPNGSGKSTLLRILAGTEVPNSGDLAVRKRLRLSYVEQDSMFAELLSALSMTARTLSPASKCVVA